jgi:hypothetical protein
MKHRDTRSIEDRLMVRAPDDRWSDEFRVELQRDRRFEGSLMRRETAVLAIVLLVILLRVIAS